MFYDILKHTFAMTLWNVYSLISLFSITFYTVHSMHILPIYIFAVSSILIDSFSYISIFVWKLFHIMHGWCCDGWSWSWSLSTAGPGSQTPEIKINIDCGICKCFDNVWFLGVTTNSELHPHNKCHLHLCMLIKCKMALMHW